MEIQALDLFLTIPRKRQGRKQEQKTTDYKQTQANPVDKTVICKISTTYFEVTTSCGGSELLYDKMKRFIKSETVRVPTDKEKEVCYNKNYNLSVGDLLREK